MKETTDYTETDYGPWLWSHFDSVSQYDMIEISICAELLLIKSIRLASLLHPALPFVTQMDIEVFSHLLVSSEHTFSINIKDDSFAFSERTAWFTAFVLLSLA